MKVLENIKKCIILKSDETYNKDDKLIELVEGLEELRGLENYDGDKFIFSLCHLTSQLIYFYKTLAKGGDTKDVVYHRKEWNLEHKLVYINIGRGFHSELADGHWCYIVNDFGTKLLVVPATSIKEDSVINENFHLVVDSEDKKGRKFISRLSLTDLRTCDAQRIDFRKDIRDVTTDREMILDTIKEKLFTIDISEEII